MSFDEQPDGDIHGECAAEIHRLEAELAATQRKLAEAGCFIKTVALQSASKPDHCNSCRQCEKNTEEAGELCFGGTPSLNSMIDEAVRIRTHDIETICDPAGMVVQIAQANDSLKALQIMYRKCADSLAEREIEIEKLQATAAILLTPVRKQIDLLVKENFGRCDDSAHKLIDIVAEFESVGSEALTALLAAERERCAVVADRADDHFVADKIRELK